MRRGRFVSTVHFLRSGRSRNWMTTMTLNSSVSGPHRGLRIIMRKSRPKIDCKQTGLSLRRGPLISKGLSKQVNVYPYNREY